MHKYTLLILSLLAHICTANAQQKTIYLDELDLSHVASGWKAPQARKAVDAPVISINGKTYERGVGTHATCMIEVDLHGTATRFTAEVGIDDKVAKAVKPGEHTGEAAFSVVANGRRLYYSDTVRANEPARKVDVDVTGVHTLFLFIDQLGPSHHDHVDWADAKFTYSGQAPNSATAPDEPEYILTPPPSPKPLYNGPARIGVRPGMPALFPLAFSGERPLKLSAKNLPKGLKLNAATRMLEGTTPATKGSYPITIEAVNKAGSARATFTLVVGDTLALTPPMGWNSWNCWGMDVSADRVKAAAHVIRQSGLADYGWNYVNIDDGWQAGRNAEGQIQSDEGFPDMKALADSVHALGLKIGLYSSPGTVTCGKQTASYQHERQDAEAYARWGYDYLKYDWCSYSNIFNTTDRTHAEHVKPYALMGDLLRAQKRDIVFSLCQYGDDHVEQWADSVHGSLWRTTGDIIDTWASVYQIIDLQNHTQPYAGPGRYNDPDMLVVGHLGWSKKLHKTLLTPSEQYYHISMWSMLAAPLLLGCDLTQLDAFTKNLLTNREVLAINQDVACKQARRIYSDTTKIPWGADSFIEVWTKPLANGDLALGIFNRGNRETTFTPNATQLGLQGYTTVRDVWRQQNISGFGTAPVQIKRHGVQLYRLARR